jgi:hypothetical protein
MRYAQLYRTRAKSKETGTPFVQDLDIDFVALRPQLL